MSALPSVLRNSAALLAGTGASKLLVLASYAILTRTLGPEGFGRYSLVFAWLAFFEVFTDSGLDALVAREGARDRPSVGRRLGDALILRVVLVAAALPIAVALAGPVTGAAIGGAVALAGLALLTSGRRPSLRSLLEIPFRLDLDLRLPILLAVLGEILHVALIAGPLRGAGVEGAVLAQAIAPLPFLFLLAAAVRRRADIRVRFDAGRLLRLLRTCAPFLGVLLLNVVLARVDVLMLQRMRGAHEVGLYAAPTRIVEVANLLAMLLMASVFPLFAAARDDEARVSRLFRESLRVLVGILAPLVAAQIAFAGPLVLMLFGRDWGGSATVLPWLAGAEILVYADIVITSRLLATGRERLNLRLLGAAAVTNVALNLVLIPEYGARGAAVATLVAYAVRVIGGFLPADGRALTRETLGAILPATVAGALAFAPSVIGGPWRAVAFAGGAIAYPVLLWLFGGVRLDDLRDLRAALGKTAPRREAGPAEDDVGDGPDRA